MAHAALGTHGAGALSAPWDTASPVACQLQVPTELLQTQCAHETHAKLCQPVSSTSGRGSRPGPGSVGDVGLPQQCMALGWCGGTGLAQPRVPGLSLGS